MGRAQNAVAEEGGASAPLQLAACLAAEQHSTLWLRLIRLLPAAAPHAGKGQVFTPPSNTPRA